MTIAAMYLDGKVNRDTALDLIQTYQLVSRKRGAVAVVHRPLSQLRHQLWAGSGHGSGRSGGFRGFPGGTMAPDGSDHLLADRPRRSAALTAGTKVANFSTITAQEKYGLTLASP
ncbi:hypothetical protein [Rhizorhabdus argentea]|uniref:hypothetical protein n=1 Tax=Rhizorhabdus argentea TaxID=1387174 RepID=UPI0030ED0B09